MAKYQILKAVEFDKLSAKFRKAHRDENHLRDRGWLLQPKYDGCFGMAIIRGNGFNQMLSRTGEDYTTSCLHILQELEEAAQEQSGGWDEFVVLGEVWHPEYSFPTISGKFRKRAASDLKFIANDLLPPGLVTAHPYALRLTNLKLLLPEIQGAEVYVSAVENLCFDEHPCAKTAAAELVARGGYDGAILRDPWALYTIGLAREGQIVKVKPALSLDLVVDELKGTTGTKTGRDVYTFSVVYRGVTTWVGSGVPHLLAEVPQPGQIVEVECMGITEDGKLREPRFKGVRHDKLAPDE